MPQPGNCPIDAVQENPNGRRVARPIVGMVIGTHCMGLRRSLRQLAQGPIGPLALFRNAVHRRSRNRVLAGPFQGMHYIHRSYGGALLPKILGCYERELYPVIEQVVRCNHDLLLDIGAAEGYFAVGLARRQQSPVVAFETDPKARELARRFAARNGVAERVDFLGTCTPSVLQTILTAADRPFILCDVEGHEATLLNPKAVPSLLKSSILVEMHEFARPGLTAEFFRRFESTHRIEVIRQEERTAEDFPYDDSWTRL
ncbi:MAG: hypothetical protein AAF961_07615, partial [Planctomycetota bacterium]